MNKQELRKSIKALRKELDLKSDMLLDKLIQTKEYKVAQNIMLFYPMKHEVDLLEILNDSSKNFFLPRVNGLNLEVCPFQKGDKLELSSFKTQEPISKAIGKEKMDIVIVPALCCDKNNYRLGYGGGFYDRFLQDYKGKTITCLPKELIVENVYQEQHDIKIDIVITD